MEDRWAIALGGDELDLEDARKLFGGPAGPIRVGVIETVNQRRVDALFARALDELPDASAVREPADRLVSILNGALFVFDPGRVPVQVRGVHEWQVDGWNAGTIFARMKGSLGRVRVTSAGVVTGGAPRPPPAPVVPKQVRWLELAETDTPVHDVLMFLRDAEPDWFNLYKAWEYLRSGDNQPWWNKAANSAFSCSAQFDRHAFGPHENMAPERRLSVEDARVFIRWLAEQWLDWRVATGKPEP